MEGLVKPSARLVGELSGWVELWAGEISAAYWLSCSELRQPQSWEAHPPNWAGVWP